MILYKRCILQVAEVSCLFSAVVVVVAAASLSTYLRTHPSIYLSTSQDVSTENDTATNYIVITAFVTTTYTRGFLSYSNRLITRSLPFGFISIIFYVKQLQDLRHGGSKQVSDLNLLSLSTKPWSLCPPFSVCAYCVEIEIDQRFLALTHRFFLFYFGTRIYPFYFPSDGRDGTIPVDPTNRFGFGPLGRGTTPQTLDAWEPIFPTVPVAL